MPQLKTVDIGKIRRELKNLWAAEALNNEHTIRAQTHNLVVYTEAPSRALHETVERLIAMTTERPGRVILIHVSPDEHDLFEVAVTSYCRMVNKKQICAELITFSVGDARRDEIHNAVVALLMPALPVYVWWDEPYTVGDHLAEHILAEAARILIDTSEYDSLEQMHPLATLKEARISDLMWSTITPWRRLLARLWDAGRAAEPLTTTEGLRVRYSGNEGRAQALLLVAWLASRLGWSSEGDIEQWTRPNGSTVDVSLNEVEGERNGLMQLAVGEGLVLAYNTDTRCISVTMGESVASYPVKEVTRGAALTEELDAGLDPAYEDALHMLTELS